MQKKGIAMGITIVAIIVVIAIVGISAFYFMNGGKITTSYGGTTSSQTALQVTGQAEAALDTQLAQATAGTSNQDVINTVNSPS